MRILLLNQTFYPDVMATSQYLADLAVRLVERGHEVTVVTGRRAYDDQQRQFARRETWRGVRIYRVGSTAFGKQAKWRRAVDFATFLLACCVRLALVRRQDVVVALTSPPLISFLGAWFTRLRGGQFVYWVMDLNPDEAVAAGWLRMGSAAERRLEQISRFSFRRAAKIIALDRFMRDRIAAKGIAPEKVVVLPPWSQDHTVHFDAAGRERFRRQHDLQGKFVVMYSGNHSPCHPLDTLLAAAQALANDPGVVFCFVGGGSEFAKVRQFAADHRLANILLLPYQPAEELAGSLSAADLHIVVMGAAFVGIIHPCKIYNVLAVGAPVLCIGPQESHLTDLLAAQLAGRFCKNVEAGAAAAVAAWVQHARAAGGRPPGDAFAGVLPGVSRGVLLPKLVTTLEALAETPAGGTGGGFACI